MESADYQAIHDQVAREFACSHSQKQLTRKTCHSGRITYRMQCRRCVMFFDVLKRGELSLLDIAKAVEYDRTLLDVWYTKRGERSTTLFEQAKTQERAAEDQEFWRRYEAHMRSPKWAAIRARVLARAKGVCEGCGQNPPAHIHHDTYDHLGDEFLFELFAVCIACHRRLHPHRSF